MHGSLSPEPRHPNISYIPCIGATLVVPDEVEDMLIRAILGVIALLELAVPRAFVDFWMALAVEDGEVELRPWVYTVARIEGLLILVWLATRSRGE